MTPKPTDADKQIRAILDALAQETENDVDTLGRLIFGAAYEPGDVERLDDDHDCHTAHCGEES